ncbi:MAG: hypothetical protein P1U89_20000 [Verrucomicrobiales bacterium]|nr:hypothetical protein [Verrucomicrobiales bacterium]
MTYNNSDSRYSGTITIPQDRVAYIRELEQQFREDRARRAKERRKKAKLEKQTVQN